MRKILFKTGKLFIILSATAVVAATGLYLFANFYGDRIKQSIVTELNKHIGMKIDVADIDSYIYLTEGADTLALNADNNLIFGGDGDDSIVGHKGDDIFSGGAGNDNFQGSGSFSTFET